MCLRIIVSICLFVGYVTATPIAGSQERQDNESKNSKKVTPIETGLVERTGTRRILLDVEVTDRAGKPIRGLTRKDFAVRLDGEAWTLHSVDDLCACDDPTADPTPETLEAPKDPSIERDRGPTAAAVIESPSAVTEPVRFIIYFDFSQLQPDGRGRATAEARRWIRESMQPDDQTMIAAYSSLAGVKVLSPFSSDKTHLESVVTEAYEDRELFDAFPGFRQLRVRNCWDCCKGCHQPCAICRKCFNICRVDGSQSEYFHGRRALKALRWFLESLEAVPGRKALLLFHQNGALHPTRHYPAPDLDHNALLEQIGAEATLSRTSIFTAYSGGDSEMLAQNLGANLADYTGGGFNRASVDLSKLTDRAGRGCACLYRLALQPPDEASTRIYTARVEVRDRTLPYRYRVTYLSDSERWLRKARSVLSDPGAAREIPLVAAIVPSATRGKRWDVKIQVAVELSSLELVPSEGEQISRWEVGALLANDGAEEHWEMLGLSNLHRRGDGDTHVVVLHERVFEGLAPDGYELRAFVRDRWTNTYGGVHSRIDLPHPDRPGILGPWLLRARSRHLRTTLPLLGDESETAESTGTIAEGNTPVGDRPIEAGATLEFVSWICRGEPGTVQRFVSQEGRPQFRFEEPATGESGECVWLTDRLETGPLSPGRYTYHLRWEQAPEQVPQFAELVFEIR